MSVNASTVKTFLELSTHPVTVISGIKDGLEGGAVNSAQAGASALSAIATFAEAVAKSPLVEALGKTAVFAALGADLLAANKEWHKYGYLSDATMMSLAADLTVLAALGAASPEIGALAVLSAATLSTAALLQSPDDTTTFNAMVDLAQSTQEMVASTGNAIGNFFRQLGEVTGGGFGEDVDPAQGSIDRGIGAFVNMAEIAASPTPAIELNADTDNFHNATLSSPPTVEIAFITLDGIEYKFNAQGEIVSMSAGDPAAGPTTDAFTLTTNPDLATWQAEADDPTSAVNSDNSTLIDTGIYQMLGLGNVNTATGNQQAANAILSDNWRPGAKQVLDSDLWANVKENYFDPQSLDYSGAYTNQQATGATLWTPVDPLILDLNGDGVKLTSFAEAPVLFDIDHDGGSKEVTGWVSGEDGIVVMDLNGNGKIDGIHETMSEYFGGTVGSDGEAGSKPYSDGFAALKSLDANGDNLFTSADTAWSSVKVWQDANHDGITGPGELKTLDELNITSISLTPATQSGLVNGGNEVLATGSFVQNGQTKEAQAARFIANPTGNSVTLTASGATVSAQDGQSTYVSSVTTGEGIDVAAKGVKNAYGNSGDDTLTGSAEANWLVGGLGSDTFYAGAGDDMLIIDAADLQANIHAGDGFDMLQVVGSEGVTLNLAQAEVEVAVGGSGNDIFIGGGRSSVFVRAGDSDDIVIGGAANDALSGENGNDLIDGGTGNDIIRGGRGQDQLMGSAGDDLIEGGLDDDRLSGGIGNDVLKGGQGDDTLDGGEGADIAEFSGSFSDYRITRLSDTSYRVVDSKSGRDGAEMLTSIEKLNFADVRAVDITLDNPMPVKDVLTIADRNGDAVTQGRNGLGTAIVMAGGGIVFLANKKSLLIQIGFNMIGNQRHLIDWDEWLQGNEQWRMAA